MTSGVGPGETDYQRLRAEWQRFKSHVVDLNTELPTLSAVLDDVRRLMEERGTLGLVYIDLGADGEAEASRGSEAHDQVVRAFAHTLVALRSDGRLGPRDVVAVMSVRSDKFLVFLRGSEGSPFDPSSVENRARRLREHLLQTLPRFLPPALNGMPEWRQGHSLMYRDPMLRAERSIHRALDEAMYMTLRPGGEEEHRAQGLDEIIGRGGVVTLYQPIMELGTLRTVGHEVFTRGPAGGPFEDAERLFALAERTGRLLDLERLCRTRALRSAPRHLKPGAKLFLNTSARALTDPEVWGRGFVHQVDEQGLAHGDVVLEVSERMAGEAREAYRGMLRELKRQGFGIAIEDIGAGYSTLQSLVELEPDYLKFEVGLARQVDQDPIKRSVLETLVELSEKIGARVIAAGIEAEAELNALRELRVPLGQGRYLGPPVMIQLEAVSVP